MDKILFFGTKKMATFWYKHTLRYLVEKGYDFEKAFLEMLGGKN